MTSNTDSDQQTLIDMNDDPLPPGSPPISSMSSSQLQRQLASDMETISVMSARSEQNLSNMNMSKSSLNTSVISAATKSIHERSLVTLDGNFDPPPYDDLNPAPSAGLFKRKHEPKRAKVYNKQNEENTDPDRNRRQKDLPQSCRIPRVSDQDRFIHCKVCHAFINVKNKLHQSVVRCSHCREATAIKAAPPGKQYVRCPCDCLLVCKSNSSRIMCPRTNCARTITVVKKPTAGQSSSTLAPSVLTNASQSKISGNSAATAGGGRVNLASNNLSEVASRSMHSLNGVGSLTQQFNIQGDDTHVHSPYSERRRNPAYGSTSSINTLEPKDGGPQRGRASSNAGSTAALLAGLGQSTGEISSGISRPDRPHNPRNGPRLVRLQCAYCNMEFVRMTPLTSYGMCPHCETRMPFGNRYTRTRQWIFSLLALATVATTLTLQLTKVLDETGTNSQFNLMFVGLYILALVFVLVVIRYSCMKVTHISESEL